MIQDPTSPEELHSDPEELHSDGSEPLPPDHSGSGEGGGRAAEDAESTAGSSGNVPGDAAQTSLLETFEYGGEGGDIPDDAIFSPDDPIVGPGDAIVGPGDTLRKGRGAASESGDSTTDAAKSPSMEAAESPSIDAGKSPSIDAGKSPSEEDPFAREEGLPGIATGIGGSSESVRVEAGDLAWEIRRAANTLSSLSRELEEGGLEALRIKSRTDPLESLIRTLLAGYLIGRTDRQG